MNKNRSKKTRDTVPISPGKISVEVWMYWRMFKNPPERSTGGLNFDISLSFSIPKFDTIKIYMK
jgi:hypothetical protein